MISTAAALLGSAALGVGGSLIQGKMSSDAAGQAADAQSVAALGSLALQQQGLDFSKSTYNQARADAAPWMQTGRNALSLYMKELTGQGSIFRRQPGYEFTVAEGEKGVKNNLAALGMKNSGAALKALTRFRTGLADQSYNSYLDRLSGLAGVGGNTVSNINQLGANTSSQVANSLSGMGSTMQDAGAARASGYVGSANAWGNALNSGVSNISNALGRYSTGSFPSAPSYGGLY